MLPFSIISNTNIVPKKEIAKFDTAYSSMYLLYSTGELYGLGRNAYSQMGTGTNTTVTTWTLISTDVSTFWISKDGDSSVLFRKNDGTWNLSGRAYIFGDSSTVYSTPTNVDDKLGVLSSGYDELYLNGQNIWYRKDGRYFRMGLNGNLNLLSSSTAPITTFTEYILQTGMKAIFPGLSGTIISYNDGSMKSIGNNNTGRYALPARQTYTTLTTITVPEVLSVQYSGNATFLNTVSGTYGCGSCMYGQLANGFTDINTYYNTPIQLTATNVSTLANYEGSTLIYYQGSVQTCGAQLRVGNGNTGNIASIVPAPNVLSTDFYVNSSASYYILNGSLYGCGQPGFYSVLPGYSTTQTSYVKLELP